LSFLLDHTTKLLLGADEKDALPAEHNLTNRLLGGLKTVERLPEVDDVDPVPLREDEALHLRIPTAGLVAEVDSGLEQLVETYFRHVESCPWGRYTPRSGCRAGEAGPVEKD
jgi:hypothetical protein